MDAIDHNGRTPLMLAAGANLCLAIKIMLSVPGVSTSGQPGWSTKATLKTDNELNGLDDDPARIDVDEDGPLFISDVENNTCFHFAYAASAASAITLLESLLHSVTRSMNTDHMTNMNSETPIEIAGKISCTLPIIPRRILKKSRKLYLGSGIVNSISTNMQNKTTNKNIETNGLLHSSPRVSTSSADLDISDNVVVKVESSSKTEVSKPSGKSVNTTINFDEL